MSFRNNKLFVLLFLFCSFASNTTNGQNTNTDTFRYFEGFETGNDPFEFSHSTTNQYKINFKGVTENNPYTGKKSFKLDVTVHKSGHFYWSIPLPKMAAEGQYKVSARIYMEGDKGTRQIGAGFSLPTVDMTQEYVAVGIYNGTPGQHYEKGWKLVEGDLVELVKSEKQRRLQSRIFGASQDDVAATIDRLYFRMSGWPVNAVPGRYVVYIDDITIESETPRLQSYSRRMAKRWNTVVQSYRKKLFRWNKMAEKAQRQLKGIQATTTDTKQIKILAGNLYDRALETIAKEKQRGYILLSSIDIVEHSLRQVGELLYVARSMNSDHLDQSKVIIYAVDPISSQKILPKSNFIKGEISNELTMTVCPGEYEPVSFVIHALRDISDLKIEWTPLDNGQGVISQKHVDIKWVTCWYQSGQAWYGIGKDRNKPVLVPELLLNDPSLVRVDMKDKRNYLKLQFPEGNRYEWISNPNAAYDKKFGRTMLPLDEFPVRDSEVILPLKELSGNTKQQVWITVKPPINSKPGTYIGEIHLSDSQEYLAAIRLKIHVLPFELNKPRQSSSIYYLAELDPSGQGTISDRLKSEKQFQAELDNLMAHGVTNPITYEPYDDRNTVLFHKMFQMRQQAGMIEPILFFLGSGGRTHAYTDPAQLLALQVRCKQIMAIAKTYGIDEVYFAGVDEAKPPLLLKSRPAWEAVRAIGGKVFTAGGRHNFDIVGDIQDLLICHGQLFREEADKWHAAGQKIFSYANPQSGPENPMLFRRNYGLMIWKNRYDGVATWAYQYGPGSIWNDFDGGSYRDHCFTYPTVDGVIDTIAWEGYREAIDDLRYVETLEMILEEIKTRTKEETHDIASQAEKYLEELDPNRGDLNEIRSVVADYIVELLNLQNN